MKDNNKGENMLTDGITDQIEANHEQQRRMRRVLEIAEYRADNYNAESAECGVSWRSRKMVTQQHKEGRQDEGSNEVYRKNDRVGRRIYTDVRIR